MRLFHPLVRQNCVPARPNIGRTTFFAVAILLCWPFWASATDLTGRASVIDGDTIEIHGQRIRLFGIDAPESRQTCEAEQQTYRYAQQAALALADHIGQRTVACEECDVDRYGRMLAVCRVDGEDIGAWMVSQGWALAYSRYSRDYFDEELAARANKCGMCAAISCGRGCGESAGRALDTKVQRAPASRSRPRRAARPARPAATAASAGRRPVTRYRGARAMRSDL